MEKFFKIKFSTNLMYYIGQKNNILVVAMQKILLATIFIQEVNDFILISDFKFLLNWTLSNYKKITIHFCSTATVRERIYEFGSNHAFLIKNDQFSFPSVNGCVKKKGTLLLQMSPLGWQRWPTQ